MLLTNNPVLIKQTRAQPTIICSQRNATKVDVTEENLIQSNINGFGDEIGKITNRITAMFDVQARFEPGSKEYEVLEYRIKCGQLLQQNAIDRIKGIISKPMPKEWYDRSANKIIEGMSDEEIERRNFNLKILADKKPYFMRYIYPKLMSQYNTYIKNTDKKCLREFRVTIDELLEKKELSDEEQDFIKYYQQRMPVGLHSCVMNKICKRFEVEFDSYFLKNTSDDEFDCTIMKSGQEYSVSQFYAILKIYEQYSRRLQEYMQYIKREKTDEDEAIITRGLMIKEFKLECQKVCSNSKQLCDIILDLCYSRNDSKQFCWDICGKEIIENLLECNNNTIFFPTLDENGDISFCGKMFSLKSREV